MIQLVAWRFIDCRWYKPSLHRCDARPASYRTAYGTPTAEAFVDLRRDCCLLFDGQSIGFNLRIGDIPDRQPARGILPHFSGNQSQYGVSHLGYVAEPLQLIVVVRGIKAKKNPS